MHHNDVITFPRTPEAAVANKIAFERLGTTGNIDGIRGIVGAMDLTHIRIVSTPGRLQLEPFRNRKTYFSINVQVP